MSFQLSVFKVTFLGIVLEALPFIVLGSLISSAIHIFVSEDTIKKFIPANPYLAIVGASFLGMIFPVCECAIIPIVRRLMKKGMPVYVAIPFMVSVPIVNPIVIFSTYMAFSGTTMMVEMRVLGGLMVAWILGFMLLNAPSNDELLLDQKKTSNDSSKNNTVALDINFASSSSISVKKLKTNTLSSIMSHTASEVLEVGGLLIFGAFLSALFKTLVPREVIMAFGQNPLTSILIMMALAFVLSLCSEADAFIARTFAGTFSDGAILAFLVLGPMIDIKNYAMLSGTFKQDFVIKLVGLIFSLVFLVTFSLNILGGLL